MYYVHSAVQLNISALKSHQSLCPHPSLLKVFHFFFHFTFCGLFYIMLNYKHKFTWLNSICSHEYFLVIQKNKFLVTLASTYITVACLLWSPILYLDILSVFTMA